MTVKLRGGKYIHATVNFDQSMIDEKIVSIRAKANALSKDDKIALWKKAVGFIDLTTLGADDTPAKIEALCKKAVNPLELPATSEEMLHTASVYVYPLRLPDVISVMKKLDNKHEIAMATVGGGFPSGQYPLETRLREIEIGIETGAVEIDIVINRTMAVMHEWNKLYEELKLFRATCGDKITLKVILAVGELATPENIYKASMVAMMAGADFIKTSTGMEAVNANLPAGIIMCRAIKDFYEATQKKVGFKPAGGIKTAQEALEWIMLVQMELGNEWLNKNLFRIGASSLLDNIITAIRSA